MVTSFVAYPAHPPEIGVTIRFALDILKEERPGLAFKGWEENDIAGRLISDPTLHDAMLDLLLWYGFLGIVRDNGEVANIYTISYDRKRLKWPMRHDPSGDVFYINPAFWIGLEIT